jgi:hypothetical protein
VSQAGLVSVAGGGGSTTFVENAGSATPAAGILNVLGGSGITTSGSGNTVTITATGLGVTWNRIIASQTLAVENGYFCVSPGGALALALPAVSSVGNEITISLDGATSWSITQSAGQSIKIGNTVTTTGVAGSLTSTQQGDTVTMICSVANLRWNVLDVIGNPTVV